MDMTGRSRRAERSALLGDALLLRAAGVGALWLAAYVAATAWARSPGAQQVVHEALYVLPIALAAVLSVLVARRRREPRWFWRLLAASNVLWLAGDLTWATYGFVLQREAPFPSSADVLYLGSYALVPAAVLLGFGASGRLRSVRGLLDASIITCALGVGGWQVLVQPQLGGGLDAATVTAVAYPLLGVVIIVTLLAAAFSAHRSVPLPVVGVAAAFGVSAVTDAGYTWAVVLNAYLPGSWLNLGWQLEAVLMCLALLLALRHDEGDLRERSRGRDLTLLPVGASVGVVLALLLGEALDGAVPRSAVLATLAVLLALVLRFAVSLLDLHRTTLRLDESLREQERLAVTDGLTGLYNRRFIGELLTIEVDRAQRSGRALTLVALDIDRFKRINDTLGHPAGDAVLVAVAQRLAGAVRGSDVLARSGGEEFLVLADDTDADVALALAERVRQAVRATPVAATAAVQVEVTVSVGVATLEEGESVEDLVRRADRALYAAKEGGRDRVATAADADDLVAPAADPAVLAVLERLAELVDARLGPDEHSAAVARWSGQLADALGLPAAQRADVALAARLHDIGTIHVPDGVLQKAGPLERDERALIEGHPAAGAELLLGLVPGSVARLVEHHHERYDGSGYPHGLRGEAIPRGARVIAVADAYAAMTARRHYAPRRGEREAAEELSRGAGTQFAPEVVAAFLGLLAAGAVEPVRPLPVAAPRDEALVQAVLRGPVR